MDCYSFDDKSDQTMMFKLFGISLFLSMHVSFSFNQNHFITHLAEEFQIKNPHIVGETKEKIKLLKTFHMNSQYTSSCENMLELSTQQNLIQTAIIFVEKTKTSIEILQQFLNNHQTTIILVLQEEQFQNIYASLKIEIHKPVYFLRYISKQMYESYTINNINVKRLLGQCFPRIAYKG